MKLIHRSGFKGSRVLTILLATGIIIFLLPTCKKKDNPASPPPVPGMKLVAENLSSPISVVEPPDDSKRLFIVDQAGKIFIVDANGSKLATPFIDIASKMVSLSAAYDERGLLSLAFHPSYKTNRKFYVFYTAPPRAGGPAPGVNWNNLTRVSEFMASSADPNLADMSSERIILEADHPQSNHNGGTIAFGPDGYLYISIGDGGASNDNAPGHVPDWYATNAGGNAQNVTANLMGKLLRIDVNSGTNYSIPSDNPYAGSSTAKKEIYAFGLRNPYRFSFDKGGSHQIFLGDAGQVLWEEVNIISKGGNYGWNVKEGLICFSTDSNRLPRPTCPSVDSAGQPLINPVMVVKNKAHPDGDGVATTVIGGNVYRGSAFPQLQGKYIFGIFSQGGTTGASGRLYIATGSANSWTYEVFNPKDLPDHLGYYLKGFGEDQAGELYLAVSGSQGTAGTVGKVFKLAVQ